MEASERQHSNLRSYLQMMTGVQAANRIIKLLQATREVNLLYVSKLASLEDSDEEQAVWDEDQEDNLSFKPRQLIQGLIDHYGVILVGALSGFFPPNLTEELIDEMIRFLDLLPVNDYYSELHKYFLPQGIMGYCFAVRNGKEQAFLREGKEPQSFFSDFLTLTRMIGNDENIQTFLKAFDNYNEIDSGRILTRLSATEAGNTAFDFENDTPDKCYKVAAIGAVSFTVFAGRFMELMERAEVNPILQSVMWHYYGYYFDTMGESLERFFQDAFTHLREQVDSNDIFGDFDVDDPDERSLYRRAISVIEEAEMNLYQIIENKKKYATPFGALASNFLFEPA